MRKRFHSAASSIVSSTRQALPRARCRLKPTLKSGGTRLWRSMPRAFSLMSYAALTVMRPAGYGSIVNLVSIMSMVGYPTSLPFSDGFTPYPHSKGAVAQMTREMGVRFGVEGVRINAVAPGFVYSPLTENVVGDPEVHAEMKRLHPMGRMGQPEEIAAVVAFLASDEASFVTASVWPVDGGLYGAVGRLALSTKHGRLPKSDKL